jgi:hypothetical protein
MSFLKTINKERICNDAFINVLSKVILSKVFLSVVVSNMSHSLSCCMMLR